MKLRKKVLLISIILICFIIKDINIEEDIQIPPVLEKKSLSISTTINTKNNIIGEIEIPKINLKKELFGINDINNDVEKNIEILKESSMPNIENGNFILAAHSGVSKKAFFKNLYKLKENDIIIIYYNNLKYEYKVTNIYTELKKDGITIYRDLNKSTITLTTCAKDYKNNQLVVIGELQSINKCLHY